MKQFVLFSFALLIFLSACSPTISAPTIPPANSPTIYLTDTTIPSVTPDPVETSTPSLALQRGVNMSNALEAPNEGDWGLYIYEDYFDLVKQAGFDFVRLPVTWNGHAQEFVPYTIDPAFFFRVDQVIEWAIERDLRIIVELHSYTDMMSNPWGNKDRFMEIWRQIAEHYKDYPSNLIFELLNEPNGQINASMWNDYVRETLAIIRQANPTREVVIGSVHWSNHDWIGTLDVPDDPHIIVTFHYYLPYEFTHQGAEWVENSNPWLGNTWDATELQKAEIARHFEAVADWAKRRNVRILLGEFGAYSKAPQDSRVRWTEFVRREAEAHGFAWAYWEFGAGFGVYDPDAKVWREDLLRVLIP